MFSLICTRINGWVNNGEAGDLRRHRAHYDVTVMECLHFCVQGPLYMQHQVIHLNSFSNDSVALNANVPSQCNNCGGEFSYVGSLLNSVMLAHQCCFKLLMTLFSKLQKRTCHPTKHRVLIHQVLKTSNAVKYQKKNCFQQSKCHQNYMYNSIAIFQS